MTRPPGDHVELPLAGRMVPNFFRMAGATFDRSENLLMSVPSRTFIVAMSGKGTSSMLGPLAMRTVPSWLTRRMLELCSAFLSAR